MFNCTTGELWGLINLEWKSPWDPLMKGTEWQCYSISSKVEYCWCELYERVFLKLLQCCMWYALCSSWPVQSQDILQDVVILQHLITTDMLPKGVPVAHRSLRLAVRSGPEQLPYWVKHFMCSPWEGAREALKGNSISHPVTAAASALDLSVILFCKLYLLPQKPVV